MTSIWDAVLALGTPDLVPTFLKALASMAVLTVGCYWISERIGGSALVLLGAIIAALALNILFHHGWNAIFYDGTPIGGRMPWETPSPDQYKTLAKAAFVASIGGVLAAWFGIAKWAR